MTAPNPTTANTELWHAYVSATYGPLIRPFWGEDGVAAVAEGVSMFMTALMGGAIARLYLRNAPEVSAFAAEARAAYGAPTAPATDAAPPMRLAPVREPALLVAPSHADTVPPWLAVEGPAAEVGAYELAGV